MSGAKRIPVAHQVVVAATVRALFGHRAVVREIVEVPAGVPLSAHVGALRYGIHAFWSRWTGRHSTGSLTTDETAD